MHAQVIEKKKLLREYTKLAPTYDSRWRKYIDASLQMTLDVLDEFPAERVLDVACGTGQLLDVLAKRQDVTRPVGVDVVPAMLKVARQRIGDESSFLQCDASKLPFDDAVFDLVVSTNALHYFTAADAALQEMHRVLSPGGHIVITDWCRNFAWMKLLNRLLPRTSHAHVHAFSERELEKSLNQAGFSVTTSTTRKIDWFWGLMTVHATTR